MPIVPASPAALRHHWHHAFAAGGTAVFVGAMASYALVVEVVLLVWVFGSVAGLAFFARQQGRPTPGPQLATARVPSRRPVRR